MLTVTLVPILQYQAPADYAVGPAHHPDHPPLSPRLAEQHLYRGACLACIRLQEACYITGRNWLWDPETVFLDMQPPQAAAAMLDAMVGQPRNSIDPVVQNIFR